MATPYQHAIDIADHIDMVDESPRELVKQLNTARLLRDEEETTYNNTPGTRIRLLASEAPDATGTNYHVSFEQCTLRDAIIHVAELVKHFAHFAETVPTSITPDEGEAPPSYELILSMIMLALGTDLIPDNDEQKGN